MNYKKDKTLNLALKSSILNNKKKNFYNPLIVGPSRNLSLNSKNYTSISTTKNRNSNIFIKKFPSKTLILSSNNSNNNPLYKNNHSIRLNMYNNIMSNRIKKIELVKNKSYQKYLIKKILTGKVTKENNIRKKLKQNINNSKNENYSNDINHISLNKNLINFNNYEPYYQINENKIIKMNDNNSNSIISNINKVKYNNKNEIKKKEKKLFGIMLKKKSIVTNNLFTKFNNYNNYSLYEQSLLNNNSRKSSYNKYNNSGSSLNLMKNKLFDSNKALFNKKVNNGIIIKKIINNNENENKKMNTISYNNNNNSTTHLTNIPHFNRIKISQFHCKKKKTLKLNLVQNLPMKKCKIIKKSFNNNVNPNRNTINITIDNTVNNIYGNVININKKPKIVYIKVNNSKNKNNSNINKSTTINNGFNNTINTNNTNTNNNNTYKIIKNIKIKKNGSRLFAQNKFLSKNDSMKHSYQNIINICQIRNKTKEKKDKKVSELIKENLKKVHEKKKKKQLLISLNNIHLNKAKLVGIQDIFSNFTEFKTKSPKFETPKIRNAFNNFNQINFSGRFNRTEEKNIDLEKYKIKKNNIKENPQYVYDYINEILTNILIAENNYFENLDLSQLNLIKNKNILSPDSRRFFINSLINIQELLNFKERTLFLTTQIFDRYINNVLLKKKIFIKEENLDIVIVTSLIIASKNEEIKLYSMSDYLNILPLKYNIHDLEKTEYEILSGLDFNLNIPSLLDFYEIFSIENKLNKFQLAKGLFLLNFILLDSNLVQIPPSLLAYAIIYIVSGKKIQFNKINEVYVDNKEKKVIKILSILKDRQMINNLCGYIKYLYKINKNSHYNAPFNKFNTPNYYFISSYLDI